MKNLATLKKEILADGKIDEKEVLEINKVIYLDGKIDLAEANFLFELNDKCSGAKNHPSWTALFVDAISTYLLDDDKSPNEVDKKEAEWLLKKIGGDGKVDRTEKELLKRLRSSAKAMPSNLKEFIAQNK